ncbi:MAG TPA: ribosome maturation factor RimP [Thermodesulfobacteriota bacterium]
MSRAPSSTVETVYRLAEPVAAALGLEVIDIEYRREGGGWVLRLFIDKPGGVSLDDCTAMSRELSPVLDVEDPIEHAYHLEVSSPGATRPLKTDRDFERFRGRRVRISTYEKIGDRKTFIGRLVSHTAEAIDLDEETVGRVSLPRAAVAKANLELDR